ncbi:MAG: GNAT family N-acetyltransferase [Deltaproteobacteria bacterium]|nr:GNAT family N-acetyltransferase [Deltaproteobacteria bacterium]
MDSIVIRRLKAEDAEGIGKIDEAITKISGKFDLERFVAEQAQRGGDASFVAEHEGRVVGFMICFITTGNFGVERCAWIGMLGVDPKYMDHGIGKRMAEEIFRFCKEKGIKDIFTSVRWDSTDLLSFFKILGFDRSNFINLRRILE